MKVAFWTLGIFVLGLLGLVLINLFGNITVTNQLNYTTMKNTVEASMYDALNPVTSFCLCTDKKKDSGKWVFKDDTEYEIKEITYKNGTKTCNSTKKYCSILEGERRIDKKTFAESLIRRFAEMVNNNKDYVITIQDIVEYPPKVSVRIDSKDDEFLPTDKGNGYTIVNQMDSIIETWGGETSVIEQPIVTPTPTAKIKSTATAKTPESGKNDGCENGSWVYAGAQSSSSGDCPTESKGDISNPKEGDYYWTLIERDNKTVLCGKVYLICASDASLTNIHGANCITASSCDEKFPSGGQITSSHCSEIDIPCDIKVHVCGKYKYVCDTSSIKGNK